MVASLRAVASADGRNALRVEERRPLAVAMWVTDALFRPSLGALDLERAETSTTPGCHHFGSYGFRKLPVLQKLPAPLR